MMEIKFRGKRIDNGEWVYGDLITNPKLQVWIKPKANAPHFNNSEYSKGFTAIIALKEVHPNTVGQYTGLKDKNGVEIYEGDVVKYNFNNSVLDTEKRWIESKVYYHNLRNTYAVNANKYMNNDLWKYTNQGTNEVEVIDNIHEVNNEN